MLIKYTYILTKLNQIVDCFSGRESILMMRSLNFLLIIIKKEKKKNLNGVSCLIIFLVNEKMGNSKWAQ